MKIDIQTLHFTAWEPLKEFIYNHVSKLDHYWDQIEMAEVTLKTEKDTADYENKVVEIRLHVPGNDLFAIDKSGSFEAAVDSVCQKLKKQIIKTKDKMYAH